MHHPPGRASTPVAILSLLLALSAGGQVGAVEAPPERAWIASLKQSPRGPFAAIRWYCHDGAVLPPEPGACVEHGGGIQHGAWNERILELRRRGYLIGNVLAELEPEPYLRPEPDLDPLRWLVLERYLMESDDGWIFRGARTYRGALQIEDEQAGSRRLLTGLAGHEGWWVTPRFVLLRELVRALPGSSTGVVSTAEVRERASRMAEQDEAFAPLRNKIHSLPDPGDAERIRAYARQRGRSELSAEYASLALAIEATRSDRSSTASLQRLRPATKDVPVQEAIAAAAAGLSNGAAAQERLTTCARAAALVRDRLPELSGPPARLAALDASLVLEQAAFNAASELVAAPPGATRRQRMRWLGDLVTTLYGAGLLSERQRAAALESIDGTLEDSTVGVGAYRRELRYLERVPAWAQRTLAFQFAPAMEQLIPLEPQALLFDQERLRASPLLAFSAILDGLLRDANELAGVRHSLLGRRVGTGLRPLNPGLARGVLEFVEEGDDTGALRRDGIYVLANTTSELPPVAGILTRGEGSSLSHVQLLARNLGIPNVVVSEDLIALLRPLAGRRVVLAASPSGVVELAEDGPRFTAVFGEQVPAADLLIRPDLAKLDLGSTRIRTLDELRAADSGRVAGPKAANLGELRHAFGDVVPQGLVIPFGVFRRMLERPLEPDGPSVFSWMQGQYAALRELPESGGPSLEVGTFLGRLRHWIETSDLTPEFQSELRAAMKNAFGSDGHVGVFVRSDTNVEDLPGFTGAGLNLTLPNVVGFDAVTSSIGRVWASPFTERAYAWRQAHMDQPEYVFPGVLLQQSFASEKSGVLVTADVDTGARGWLSIAVNEGVGGAVEGQAAEELRVDAATGRVRLLAQASAPRRAELMPEGGLRLVAASGSEWVLTPDEIERLRVFAQQIPSRFPGLVDDTGDPRPADVEFAFRDGRLALLQLRPFLESRRARSSLYLQQLGGGGAARGNRQVSLDAPPLIPRDAG